MAQSFVRVPPDSTGKKVGTALRRAIRFDNIQNGGFAIGDTVTGVTSGATGVITSIITEGFSVGSGELYLKKPSITVFVDNEDLQVSASTKGIANIPVTDPGVDIEFQRNIIVDPNNPTHQQKIDEFGATVNTFSDGAPTFGPFGGMLIIQQETIKDYKYAYDELPNEFNDVVVGTSPAEITYIASESSVLLNTGTPGTEANNSAIRQSHFYHPYQPGTGTLIEQSVVFSAGQANNTRRWGLFDDGLSSDGNGVFWELSGTTLKVVLRNQGVDTAVTQPNFSHDKLDGTDAQGFSIDLTKTNIFWIDFQWLGAGRIKFGIFDSMGTKITVHIIENSNTSLAAYMRTATLPIRFENFNTGITSSNSTLKIICTTVKSYGNTNRQRHHFSHQNSGPPLGLNQSDGEKPILSLRPKLLFLNSQRNSVLSELAKIDIAQTGSNISIVRIRKNVTTLPNANWIDHNILTSAVQYDESATSFTGGEIVWSGLHIGGTSLEHLVRSDKLVTEIDDSFNFILEGDNITQQTLTVTLEIIDSGGAGNFSSVMDWTEIQL